MPSRQRAYCKKLMASRNSSVSTPPNFLSASASTPVVTGDPPFASAIIPLTTYRSKPPPKGDGDECKESVIFPCRTKRV